MDNTLIFELPSNGLVYEASNPLSLGKLELRYGKATDEDILANASLIRNNTVLYKLIESLIIDKSIDLDTMIVEDHNAAVLAARVSMYGEKYKTKIKCPECGASITKEVEINPDKFKYLEIEPAEPRTNKFKYKTSFGNDLVLKLLTIKDLKEIEEVEKASKKINPKGFSPRTQQLRRQILSVNGESEMAKIIKFIDNLSSRESKEIRDYIRKISPAADLKTDFVCFNCGLEIKDIETDIDVNFFWEIENNT